jgi:hypothetical protein
VQLVRTYRINLVTLKANHLKKPLNRRNSPLIFFTLLAILMLISEIASAFEIVEWRFQTSVYTKHWDPDPDHENNSKLLNIEFTEASGWSYGFAHFDNSFGQPSQYLYAGRTWRLLKKDWAYFKLTGGFLHGYKEPHEDKIPFNGLGVAPAIIPTFGLQYKRVHSELQILGLSAITITAGFSFGRKSD